MVEKTLILGCDPGLTGAWAIYATDIQMLLQAPRMMPVSKWADGKNHIDSAKLGFEIDMVRHKIAFAVVEEPGAMPGQGVTSMFRFGYACGMIEGILGALQIKMMHVKPSVWKIQMGLSSNKKVSVDRASKYFPEHTHLFSKRNGDGLAEAALLAKFGERYFKLKTL